jgi:hypothetical protein
LPTNQGGQVSLHGPLMFERFHFFSLKMRTELCAFKKNPVPVTLRVSTKFRN